MRRLFLTCIIALAGSSSLQSAPPSFFPLGGDIYHAKDRDDAEKQPLKFSNEPRWFVGFPREVSREEYDAWQKKQTTLHQEEPFQGERAYQIPTRPAYPQSIDAVSKQDQGATLQLATATDANATDGEIVFTLTLTSGDRAIEREIEHRRTNVLPFLFAFTADGKPVVRESRGGVSNGGTNRFIELVPARSQKTWTLRCEIDSLAKILPAEATEATIIAVFSERQHEHYEKGGPISLDEIWSSEALKKRPPQIVLRSNEIRLHKEGATWGLRKSDK